MYWAGKAGEHIPLGYLQEVCEGNGSLQFVEYSLHFCIFTGCFKFVGEAITLTYFTVFEYVKRRGNVSKEAHCLIGYLSTNLPFVSIYSTHLLVKNKLTFKS